MSAYLDASVVVALFVEDDLSNRAAKAFDVLPEPPTLSDYAALEFAASITRMMRAGMLTAKESADVLSEFDTWRAARCVHAETTAEDVDAASALVRTKNIALRTSDAIHAAIAKRMGLSLMTFDKKLASNARRLGVTIA